MNLKVIKELCKAKGISLQELGDGIGSCRTSLSRVITSNKASIKLIEKIAHYFGCPISIFFEEESKGITDSINPFEAYCFVGDITKWIAQSSAKAGFGDIFTRFSISSKGIISFALLAVIEDEDIEKFQAFDIVKNDTDLNVLLANECNLSLLSDYIKNAFGGYIAKLDVRYSAPNEAYVSYIYVEIKNWNVFKTKELKDGKEN